MPSGPLYFDVLLTNEICSQKSEPDARFKAFYDTFPTDCSNFPLLYTAKDLAYLEGTYAGTVIAAHKATWAGIHKWLSEKLPNEFKYSLEDYLKAYSIKKSKTLEVQFSKDYSMPALIPIVEMVNNENSYQESNVVAVGNGETGDLVLMATKEIKRWEEIRMDKNLPDRIQQLIVFGHLDDE